MLRRIESASPIRWASTAFSGPRNCSAAPRFDGAMTKAENRAAAKAYHQERMRKLEEEGKPNV
jgi:hypothetical protein